MGHMTRPRPYQGQFVVRIGCDLHIQPVGYIKFGDFAISSPITNMRKGRR